MLQPGDLSSEERVRPLTRLEYERLVEAGAFESERVELLRGFIVTTAPHGPEHDGSVEKLTYLLLPPLIGRAVVRIASSLAATDDSEPEPDIAVVPAGDHQRAHPSTAYLLIEVAKTSLRKDRAVKTGIYATAGVDEYWIVNLVDRCIEVHRSPRDGRYEQVTVHRGGDRLALVRFPDVTLAVSDVLPSV